MPLRPQILPFTNLRGVQTAKSITDYLPDEALSCVGGLFLNSGAFEKRKGGEKYNTTALSSEIIGGYDFRFNNDANQQLLLVSGTDLYKGNSGSPTSIYSSFTSGLIPDFAEYAPYQTDYAFVSNGTDTMIKYDGTTITNAGITRPSSAPSGAANSGGSLTASSTYLVRVTFVRDNGSGEIQESNPSDVLSVTLGAGETQIDLTGIPISSDSQVNKRYVYMSNADGAILFFNQEIADNTTTGLSLTDLSLGAEIQYNLDTPPNVKYLEQHREKLFGAGDPEYPNRLYFSKDIFVWYWPQGELDQEDLFYIEVGDGSPITGIKSYFDDLLIFKENEIYKLSGFNEFSFALERLRTNERVGCRSNRGIWVVDNYCYFVSSDGLYRTNGLYVEEISYPINDFFREDTNDSTYAVNKNQLGSSILLALEEKKILLFFYATGSNVDNNMCLMMDLKNIYRDQATGKLNPNWAPWPGFTTQCAFIVNEVGREHWFRGDENGYLFRQDQIDGDGSEVTSTATSSTGTTLTDSTQSWTVNLYAGLRVIITKGTGAGQERIISSNTATELTITVAWSTNPDDTSVYAIGGIPYHYTHSWNDYGNPSLSKRLRWIRPRFDTTGSFPVNIYYGFDYVEEEALKEIEIDLGDAGEFDVSLYDVAIWDGSTVSQDKYSVSGSNIHRVSNIKIENNNAGQPITYNGLDKIFMMKGIR